MPRRPLTASTSWLSVTPEPERLLPDAVATLRAGARAPIAAIEQERARVERLVVRARLRDWLAYLSRTLALVERRLDASDPEVVRARETAAELIANHHNLLLGLPGPAAQRTAGERARLQARASALINPSTNGASR
jgi:hypothetical protein